MPPIPNEYHGRDAAARFYTRITRQGRTTSSFRRGQMVSRHWGPPAASDGIRRAAGFAVLSLAGDRICAVTRFENSLSPGSI